MGLRKPIHVLTLEYGIWSKADAENFIEQLTRDGFKKRVSSVPDIGGGNHLQTVSYKKGTDEFTYSESYPSGSALYLFTLNNENYRP